MGLSFNMTALASERTNLVQVLDLVPSALVLSWICLITHMHLYPCSYVLQSLL